MPSRGTLGISRTNSTRLLNLTATVPVPGSSVPSLTASIFSSLLASRHSDVLTTAQASEAAAAPASLKPVQSSLASPISASLDPSLPASQMSVTPSPALTSSAIPTSAVSPTSSADDSSPSQSHASSTPGKGRSPGKGDTATTGAASPTSAAQSQTPSPANASPSPVKVVSVSSPVKVSAASQPVSSSRAASSSTSPVVNGGIAQVNSSGSASPSSAGSSSKEATASTSSSPALPPRSSSASNISSPSTIDPTHAIASNVVTVPGSTMFSTTTDTPDSTFATPVSITVKAKNGQNTLSAPPLITSVSPSTATDGTVVEVTHVISNPNNNGNLNTFGHHSFFDNHGAVIGTFIAAGIVAALLLASAIYLVRRHRRRAKRRRLQAMLPSDPFNDPDEPVMSQRFSGYHDHGGYGEISPSVRQPETARVYADAGPSSPGATGYAYEGPFSDYHSHRRNSISNEEVLDIRAPSRQVSTPSIYPPSLSDDDDDSLYQKEVQASPRPARSVLSSEYIPLERVGARPSTQESELAKLNKEHPPMMPALSMEGTTSSVSYEYSSSQGPGTPTSVNTPISENGTLVASEEGAKGHPMLPSPPSAFLRRQLSKRTPINVPVAPTTFVSRLSTNTSTAPGAAL